MATLIKRKILRTRFFDKPVLLMGSEKINAANFQQQSFDTAVQEITENKVLLYKDVNAAEQEKDASLLRKEGGLIVGAYDPQMKVVTNPAITVEHLFVNLGRLRDGSFRNGFDSVIARNHDVIVTMDPWRDKGLEKDPQLIDHILNGQYDPVFKELFSIIASTNRTVYLRWLHEMEIPITRYPWQSQDPIAYIKAFRYFVNMLQPKPANVFIVWGPAGDRGSIEFWPGSDVVDYISIAIYGLPDKNITDHNKQESFNTIFKRKYNRLKFAHKPLFITEFGVKGPQDYKKKWLQEAAVTINAHPEIIGINYFNYADSPKAWGDIETPDWSTSAAVFDGFLKQLHTGSIK
jgi:beta-mannanase